MGLSLCMLDNMPFQTCELSVDNPHPVAQSVRYGSNLSRLFHPLHTHPECFNLAMRYSSHRMTTVSILLCPVYHKMLHVRQLQQKYPLTFGTSHKYDSSNQHSLNNSLTGTTSSCRIFLDWHISFVTFF